MNIFGSMILTGASIGPVLIVYGIVGLFECAFVEGIAVLLTGLFFVAIGFFLITYLKKGLEKIRTSFSSVEAADRESIVLLVLYILPLLRTSFQDLTLLILVPAVAIFLALSLTGNNYHFNPLFNLFGWHFYKVRTPGGITYALITRRDMRGRTEEFEVGRLAPFTVIDLT